MHCTTYLERFKVVKGEHDEVGVIVERLLLNHQQMEPKWFYCDQERAVRF